jgi:hypothetical protein
LSFATKGCDIANHNRKRKKKRKRTKGKKMGW